MVECPMTVVEAAHLAMVEIQLHSTDLAEVGTEDILVDE